MLTSVPLILLLLKVIHNYLNTDLYSKIGSKEADFKETKVYPV